MRISDQSAAIKLAICDDTGERSYDAADVAAILVQMLSRLPTAGLCTSCINLSLIMMLFVTYNEILVRFWLCLDLCLHKQISS